MEKLKKFSDDLVRRPSIFVIIIACITLMYFLFTDNAFYVGCDSWNTLFHFEVLPDDSKATTYVCAIAFVTWPILFLMLIETIFKKIRFSKKLAQNKYIKSILLTFATIYAFYAVPSTINWTILLIFVIWASM